jgi:hypothetical protein
MFQCKNNAVHTPMGFRTNKKDFGVLFSTLSREHVISQVEELKVNTKSLCKYVFQL